MATGVATEDGASVTQQEARRRELDGAGDRGGISVGEQVGRATAVATAPQVPMSWTPWGVPPMAMPILAPTSYPARTAESIDSVEQSLPPPGRR